MKMHTPNLTIGVVVVVLIAGAVAVAYNNQKTSFPSSAVEKINPDTSEAPTLAANAERYSSSDSGEFYMPESTSPATPAPSPAPLENYVYPGSTVLKKNSFKLDLESQADAAKITNWYKDKIKGSNFNAKSFAQTNTNGTILNKLSAAKPGEKIEVTIKKDQTGSKVAITVDRS